jgi:hypothetical protein
MGKAVITKAVGALSGVGWHRLLRVAALLLVLPHQAVAGIVCLCQQECVTRHTAGQAAQSAAPHHLCYLEPDESGTFAEIGEASMEEQSGTPPGLVESCCQAQAQPEYQAASAAVPIPLPSLILSSHQFELTVFKSIPSPAWDHYLRRSQPLYITHCCCLI